MTFSVFNDVVSYFDSTRNWHEFTIKHLLHALSLIKIMYSWYAQIVYDTNKGNNIWNFLRIQHHLVLI